MITCKSNFVDSYELFCSYEIGTNSDYFDETTSTSGSKSCTDSDCISESRTYDELHTNTHYDNNTNRKIILGITELDEKCNLYVDPLITNYKCCIKGSISFFPKKKQQNTQLLSQHTHPVDISSPLLSSLSSYIPSVPSIPSAMVLSLTHPLEYFISKFTKLNIYLNVPINAKIHLINTQYRDKCVPSKFCDEQKYMVEIDFISDSNTNANSEIIIMFEMFFPKLNKRTHFFDICKLSVTSNDNILLTTKLKITKNITYQFNEELFSNSLHNIMIHVENKQHIWAQAIIIDMITNIKYCNFYRSISQDIRNIIRLLRALQDSVIDNNKDQCQIIINILLSELNIST